MLLIGSIPADVATAVGVLAGLIAVAGFLAHARPVLRGDTPETIQKATVIGGLAGCVGGILVVVLSATTW